MWGLTIRERVPATRVGREAGVAGWPVQLLNGAGARGRYFNTVDLVTRLKEQASIGKAGVIAAQLSRIDLVVPGGKPDQKPIEGSISRLTAICRSPVPVGSCCST